MRKPNTACELLVEDTGKTYAVSGEAMSQALDVTRLWWLLTTQMVEDFGMPVAMLHNLVDHRAWVSSDDKTSVYMSSLTYSAAKVLAGDQIEAITEDIMAAAEGYLGENMEQRKTALDDLLRRNPEAIYISQGGDFALALRCIDGFPVPCRADEEKQSWKTFLSDLIGGIRRGRD